VETSTNAQHQFTPTQALVLLRTSSKSVIQTQKGSSLMSQLRSIPKTKILNLNPSLVSKVLIMDKKLMSLSVNSLNFKCRPQASCTTLIYKAIHLKVFKSSSKMLAPLLMLNISSLSLPLTKSLTTNSLRIEMLLI
jgi:hypothetical protein